MIDADETLLDFQKAQRYGFIDVIRHFGVPFSEKLYSEFVSINHQFWGLFEQNQMDKSDVQSCRFSQLFKNNSMSVEGIEADCIYQESLKKQSWLIPSAEEVCSELSKSCEISIITNGVGETQKQRILSSAISPFVANIFTSEEVGFMKPDTRFFEFVFDRLGIVNTQGVLLIGDSISSDIQGAINASIDSCWFNPLGKQLPKGIVVKYEISDLRQLVRVIHE